MVYLSLKHAKFVPAPRLVGIEPNPGPGRGVHLDESTRLRIVTLSQDAHWSTKQIAHKVNCSREAVSLVLSRYRERGTAKDKPGRGRKRKLSNRECKEMARQAKKGKPATELARTRAIKTKKEVSRSTVSRALRKEGLRNLKVKDVEALSAENKAERLKYSKDMKGYDFKRVLFSDEKKFPLRSGLDRQWMDPRRRVSKEVQRWPEKIEVWGACGYYMKAPLYFWEGTMKAPLYQKIIKSGLKQSAMQFSDDCPADLRQNWVYLQDGARPHIATKSMKVLHKLVGDRVTPHPANSPDLNLMEDVWSYLVHRLKTANIKTLQGLKRKIKEEYDAMPFSEFRKSVDSMPKRLQECEMLQGARTHY